LKPILSRIFKDFWDVCIILLVLFLSMGFIAFFDIVSAFNLPNQGKYKSFIERSKQTSESEIEPSRSAQTGRKASENKRPWLADSFLDMENMVDPMADSGGLGGSPKYLWPDGTRKDYPLGTIGDYWLLYVGCSVSCPSIMEDNEWCEDTARDYSCKFTYGAGIITSIKIKGPAKITKWGGFNEPINVRVYQNVTDATITVIVKTLSVGKHTKRRIRGSCESKTHIICDTEPECSGRVPSLYAAASTIAPGGTRDITVDSAGYAVPPYTWSVAGTGYTLDKATTENDLEYVTLTSAGAPCGAGYGAYATVTVTDACGLTDTAYILNTGGAWTLAHESIGASPTYSNCGQYPGDYYEEFTVGLKHWKIKHTYCMRNYEPTSNWTAAGWDQAWNPPCGLPNDCVIDDGTCTGDGCAYYADYLWYYDDYGCP